MNGPTQTAISQPAKQTSIFWPQRILGPQPGLKEVNFICWAMFLAFLVVPICVVHWMQTKQGNGSYTQLNSDFVLYYGDGTLVLRYSPTKVYDPALQRQVFNEIQPSPDAPYGLSPYPPIVPIFFSLLARLPFNTAYFLWMTMSLASYCVGIRAVAKVVFPGEGPKFSILLCLALAFYPFVVETLFNGQLSAVAVLAVGSAIYQERRGRSFYGGLALGLLSYKPTLLVLMVPMLLLTRRFRMFAGFVAGALALFLIGTAYGGLQVWPAYVRLLQFNSHLAGVHGGSALRLQKYLDFSSISHTIPNGRTAGILIIVSLVAVGITAVLAYLLWKSKKGPRPAQWLAWAAVLTWTLMLNVYVPIYDSILVVPAVILTLGALRDLNWSKAAEWVTFLAVLIFAASWITESVAKAHGIQLLTVAFFVLGAAQIYFLNKANRQSSFQELL